MSVVWRESLAIGISEIDSQHKELLARFGNLLAACKESRGISELRSLLAFLDDYVIVHFRDEEQLQVQHNYPDQAEHKRQHTYFIARLKELKQEVESDGVALHHVIEVNNMLLNWLINHISVVDKELGRFLQEARKGN